jgi:tripartite-type tricarboxylate transporter receptor subunit TctC
MTRSLERGRRVVAGFFLFSLALLGPGPALAGPYPERSITIIVPFPAGGSTDTAARLLADALSRQMGQPVVIENRGGAGGTIGSALAARAAPDGYTLLIGSTSTHAVAPSLYAAPGYDPVASFEPISLVASGPLVLVIHPSVHANAMQDLIALAKSSPGQLNFGSAGIGTTSHLVGEMFKSMADIDVVHVAYRGGAPALNDLLAGRLQFLFDTVQLLLPQIDAKKITPLAVTAAKRHPSLPDVPTVAEAGLPGFEAELWFGLLAPAGTSPPILDRLNAETVKALASPGLARSLSEKGIDPVSSTRQEFAAYMARERAKWGTAVVESGAKLE